MPRAYIGRFAPSPTGPLHFGSLIAALASFLDARHHGGRWRVRMEDIDPPREMPGAAEAILAALHAFGLTWDGEVLYQSQRREAYRETQEQLTRRGLTFWCTCSRRDLAPFDGRYPGTCRHRRQRPDAPAALRVRWPNHPQHFDDRLQGPQTMLPDDLGGDFVIHRKDGLPAYQLATAVDDHWQGITHVVRGADLLESSFRQQYLLACLGHTPPAYAHVPVAVNRAGRKLSKQTRARALDTTDPLPTLLAALRFLHQPLPRPLPVRTKACLDWAIAHWSLSAVPATLTAPPAATPDAFCISSNP